MVESKDHFKKRGGVIVLGESEELGLKMVLVRLELSLDALHHGLK